MSNKNSALALHDCIFFFGTKVDVIERYVHMSKTVVTANVLVVQLNGELRCSRSINKNMENLLS